MFRRESLSVLVYPLVFVVISFSVVNNCLAQNLVQNPEFDLGLDFWDGWIDDANTEVNMMIDDSGMLSGDNSLMLEIIVPGQDVWQIQRNTLVPIEAGYRYIVHFLAMADYDDVPLTVLLEENQDPWAKQLDAVALLQSEPQLFEFVVDTMPITDETNRLKLHAGGPDNEGVTIWIDSVVVRQEAIGGASTIDNIGQIPQNYSLLQNYPNPFNPSTTIAYNIPVATEVRLTFTNILGEEIAMLAEGKQPAGQHQVTFDASQQVSGLYFYKLQTDAFTEVRKMLLVE